MTGGLGLASLLGEVHTITRREAFDSDTLVRENDEG